MKEPLVSIIIPVYNAAATIRETIRSVRVQTCTDWELILVDDGSRDASMQIIREEIADLPARLLQNTHDGEKGALKGPAGARNTGVDAARGRYIAFLDADDIWLPDKLAHQLAFVKARGAAFSCTSYVFGDEQGQPTRHVVHAPDRMDYRRALTRTVIFTSTVMLDRETLPPELTRMPVGIGSEDTACWWRIMQSGVDVAGLDEVLTIYRRPAHSLSSNKGRAVQRIWRLYREVAGLSVIQAAWCLVGWAVRATLRRIL